MESKKQQATKNKIYLAIINLLSNGKSLEDLTVTDISSQAEISRKTFYSYYKNLPSLIDQLERQIWSDVLQLYVPIFSYQSLSTPQFAVRIVKYVSQHPTTVQLIRLTKEQQLLSKFIKDSAPNTEQHLLEIIPKLGESSKRATSLMLHYFVYGVAALLGEWIDHNFQDDTTLIAYLIYQLSSAPFFNLNDPSIYEQIEQQFKK